MAVINVLDKHIAELIAAGEVVEKPASVVKELVENSIDAGAANIIVDIENGGIKKILVQDDGSGIDSEYAKTAFVRHATSKISTKDDLDSIHSLGFRGEALASIASVSRLSLITKTAEQDFGVEFKISGGQEESFEVKPFVNGSRFIIKDLFYNTPARMKFLKKDSTEAGYIQEIITNLALSSPNISFTFKKDGKDVFSTIGDGNLQNTIAGLFGTSFANEIIPVDHSDEKYKVTGFTTLPHFSRQSRNMQFLFINGRYVKNKTIIAAVENAYKGSVMVGKFPGYILNITMPYEIVDVNVHPTKTEVRFSNDSEVFSAVYRAIKQAISQNNMPKTFNFQNKPSIEFFTEKENIVQQKIQEITDTKPSTDNLKINTQATKNIYNHTATQNLKEVSSDIALHHSLLNSDNKITPYLNNDTSFSSYNTSFKNKDIFIPVQDGYISPSVMAINSGNTENTSNLQEKILLQNFNIKVIGEIFDTYIICECDNSIILVDKHAAHERLLYEKLIKNCNCDKQMLLAPVIIKLSALEKESILNNLEILEAQGFELEDFGLNGVKLNAIPMNIEKENPQSLIEEIAENLSKNKFQTLSEKQEWIMHSVACRSAIKAGDKANISELTTLILDIKQEKIPLFCPHGRPIIVTITKKELEKQFGRV